MSFSQHGRNQLQLKRSHCLITLRTQWVGDNLLDDAWKAFVRPYRLLHDQTCRLQSTHLSHDLPRLKLPRGRKGKSSEIAKRHGSSTPGPLEARRRANKRRMTELSSFTPDVQSDALSFYSWKKAAEFLYNSQPKSNVRYEAPSSTLWTGNGNRGPAVSALDNDRHDQERAQWLWQLGSDQSNLCSGASLKGSSNELDTPYAPADYQLLKGDNHRAWGDPVQAEASQATSIHQQTAKQIILREESAESVSWTSEANQQHEFDHVQSNGFAVELSHKVKAMMRCSEEFRWAMSALAVDEPKKVPTAMKIELSTKVLYRLLSLEQGSVLWLEAFLKEPKLHIARKALVHELFQWILSISVPRDEHLVRDLQSLLRRLARSGLLDLGDLKELSAKAGFAEDVQDPISLNKHHVILLRSLHEGLIEEFLTTTEAFRSSTARQALLNRLPQMVSAGPGFESNCRTLLALVARLDFLPADEKIDLVLSFLEHQYHQRRRHCEYEGGPEFEPFLNRCRTLAEFISSLPSGISESVVFLRTQKLLEVAQSAGQGRARDDFVGETALWFKTLALTTHLPKTRARLCLGSEEILKGLGLLDSIAIASFMQDLSNGKRFKLLAQIWIPKGLLKPKAWTRLQRRLDELDTPQGQVKLAKHYKWVMQTSWLSFFGGVLSASPRLAQRVLPQLLGILFHLDQPKAVAQISNFLRSRQMLVPRSCMVTELSRYSKTNPKLAQHLLEADPRDFLNEYPFLAKDLLTQDTSSWKVVKLVMRSIGLKDCTPLSSSEVPLLSPKQIDFLAACAQGFAQADTKASLRWHAIMHLVSLFDNQPEKLDRRFTQALVHTAIRRPIEEHQPVAEWRLKKLCSLIELLDGPAEAKKFLDYVDYIDERRLDRIQDPNRK